MIFNEEQRIFIKENAFGLLNEELTKRLNEKYKTNFTVGQVKKFKNVNHISSGLKSCNLPIGSERKDKKGYILIKIAQPNVWKEKHRVVYENVYGEIPEGHKIIFLDSDKNNFNIENLILLKNSEMAYINKQKLAGINKEFTNVAISLAKLKTIIAEVENGIRRIYKII